MSIPDYQTIMLPLLKALGDGNTYTTRDLIDAMAVKFQLSDDERKELLPSGQDVMFNNRVRWSSFYLKKAGLVLSEQRGLLKISIKGLDLLKKNPIKLTLEDLKHIPEFKDFLYRDNSVKNEKEAKILVNSITPEEQLEQTYLVIRQDLVKELLSLIKTCSPEFFEKLVVDVIVSMGYGGSRQDAGKAVGKSGDGGIDGIIKEDRLGLDVIYIQAKRWIAAVPVKEVRCCGSDLIGHCCLA